MKEKVQICELHQVLDANHPAVDHDCKQKDYGAFAKAKLPKHTVLGPYGGVTKMEGDVGGQ